MTSERPDPDEGSRQDCPLPDIGGLLLALFDTDMELL